MIVGSAEVVIEPSSRGFAQKLEGDLEGPTRSVGAKLGGILAAAISVREIGQFFKGTVDAASDTVESINKVGVVFGEAAGQVEEFAAGADVLGLANQQALEAAGGFGNLFSAMGLAEAQSASMSTSLVGLAGDLASFQNTSVEEALTALTSGIVGETEPLRRYGVTLSDNRLRAEAMAQGIEVGSGAIDAQTKALLTYSIIMEDTANAQGDALKTGGDLAGQQRQLTAEWSNAKAEIGAGLLPAVLEMVEATRGDLVPTIVELAESAVPLLIEGFQIAEPLLGSTTTILRALAPGLEAVATVIDAIPGPLIAMATQGYAASRAVGFLSSGVESASKTLRGFRSGVSGAGDAAGAAAGGFSKLNVVAGIAGAAVTAGVAIYSAATESAREYDRQVDALATSMDSVLSGQLDVNDAVADFLSGDLSGDSIDLGDEALDAMRALLGPNGLGQIREAVLEGGDALEPFREALERLGIELDVDVGRVDNTADEILVLGDALRELHPELNITSGGIRELIGETENADEALQESAERAINLALANGDLTEKQLGTAVSQAGLTEASENWLRVASFIGGEVAEIAGVTGDMTGANEGAAGPIRDVTEALEREKEVAEEVASTLNRVVEAQLKAFSADLDYEQAVAAFSDSLAELTEAEQTVADIAAGKGEGDEALFSSSQGLVDAQRDARRSMADATERVAAAESALADARAEYGPNSEAAARAERELADARENYADTERTTSRSVTDARKDVADAEVSATEAAVTALKDLRDVQFDVQEKAVGMAQSAQEAAEWQAELQGRTLGVNEGYRAQVTGLREAADQAAAQLGPDSTLRVELDALADEIEEKIARNHEITFTADLVPVLTSLKRLNELGLGASVDVLQAEKFLMRGAADGFSGTVNRPTMFLTGEGGAPEDVLVVPQHLGGISKVLSDFAASFGGGGDAFGRTGVQQNNTFHIVESGDGRSTAMRVAKRLRGAGFRGGLSGLLD